MKYKYDDAVFEAFLKSAFQEAAAQDIAELEAMDIEIRYPTEKQRREIEREIRRAERKASSRVRRAWRTVAMIAIVCSLTFGMLMIQPSVRASVFDVVVSFFEKYLSFSFNADTQNATYAMGEYTITYVPGEYILKDKQEDLVKTVLTFKNGESALFIYLYPTPFSQAYEDNENATTEAVTVGDMQGYLMQYDNNSVKKLIWGDEKHTFTVRGAISEDEILKIAKNIK